jgi:hypothetical protein
MDLPQADDADPASVFTATFGVPFQTHPDKAALLVAREPIAVSMSPMMLKNGATDVAGNARLLRIGQWLQSMTEAPTQVKLAAIQA